ncbi:hypothetical protein Patl1_11019 [Pistacia atlantica]|uniref:Uncharacterized protein n=1 Tax=Pistacia atlantica TaxID=434234 RepID=A0ACC1A2Z5_9ROSI|nr:hypothetical protein Patl1_11019 [Pistacia atlantica]
MTEGIFKQEFEPTKIELLEDDEVLLLEFSGNLPVGMGVLAIGFEGMLNEKMKGFYRSFTQRTWKMSKPWRKLEVHLVNLIKYGLYFWHKDVPLYYRIRLCEMVDITIYYLMAQFCGEKELCVGTIEKGDQALNRNFNHQKSSTLYYKVFGKVNCHFSSVILCLSDAGTANVDGIKDTNGTTQLCDSKISETAQGVMLGCDSYSGLSVEGLKLILPLNAISDVGLHDQNYSASKKIVGKGDSFTPKGFPPLGSCLSTGQDREQNDQPSDVKQNPIGSGHDKVTSSVPRGRFVHFLVKFWLKYQLHVKSISLTLALKTVQSTV